MPQAAYSLENLESRRLLAGGFPIIAGGTGAVDVTDIRTVSNGNIVVAGAFNGTVDFNPAGGATRSSAGANDAFVAVYAVNGKLRWVSTWGGRGNETAAAIAIDPLTKDIVVAGDFTSRFTFPIGNGSQRVGLAGIRDAYVGTFSSAGQGISLQQFGKSGSMFVEDVEVSHGGLVAMTGSFNGEFDADPISSRVQLRTSPEGREAGFTVVLKTTRRLFWSASAEADENTVRFRDAAFDPVTEAVIVAGEATANYEILTAAATTSMDAGGGFSAAAIKFDRDGNLVYSRAVAGSDLTAAYGVVVDRAGSAYLTGEFADVADLDTGRTNKTVFQTGPSASGSGFALKLSTTGRFVWGNAINGDGFVLGQAISFNSDGQIAIAGAFSGTADFDPSSASHPLTARRFVSNGRSSTGVDVFTSTFNASTGALIGAQRFGGIAREFVSTITLDGSGHLFTDVEPATGDKRTLVVRWDE